MSLQSVLKIATLAISTFAATSAWAAELVMIERPGCPWCARWDRDVAPIYPKTSEASIAPLRRLDIDAVGGSGITVARPVHFTPTFLLVDDGREIGRITGYINDDMFWGLLDKIIDNRQNAAKTAAALSESTN